MRQHHKVLFLYGGRSVWKPAATLVNGPSTSRTHVGTVTSRLKPECPRAIILGSKLALKDKLSFSTLEKLKKIAAIAKHSCDKTMGLHKSTYKNPRTSTPLYSYFLYTVPI